MAVDVTADPASVRERIAEELRRMVVAGLAFDPADVQLWDRRGNRPESDPASGAIPEQWALITLGEEDQEASDGPDSAIGMETMTLGATVDVHLLTEPAGMSTDVYGSRWIARIKQVLRANLFLEEGGSGSGGEELALMVRIMGSFGPADSGSAADILVGCDIEVDYRHPEGDPYAVG